MCKTAVLCPRIMLDLMLLLNALALSQDTTADKHNFTNARERFRPRQVQFSMGTNKYSIEWRKEMERERDANSENDLAKNDEYQANWILVLFFVGWLVENEQSLYHHIIYVLPWTTL